jgi:glycosyltransferase involved in cell wall biosynthesis
MTQPKIAYISFDTVPAPKGAAIHIAAFSQALASKFGEIQLVTVSPTNQRVDCDEIYPQVKQIMLPAVGDNLINRVLYFRRFLRAWLQGRKFEVIQIRSIYEGYEIALNKKQYCDFLIFEVNGLPSIELKYRYPGVVDDKELLHKLHSQEQICLEAADLIVTPSSVTKKYLESRKIASDKIRVIPNGVDLDVFLYCFVNSKKFWQLEIAGSIKSAQTDFVSVVPDFQFKGVKPFQMLYFGTLSPWQGVNLAVEALGLINRDFPANLTVIGQGRDYQIKVLKQLALKLEVADKLTILEPMSQNNLVEQIHASNAILAPLTPNDRNLVQGCCPLKILEGMATGIPVIASDLSVVREFGLDGVHFLLIKPGSAKAIKDTVLRLYQNRELATQLATNARKHIEDNYTWKLAGDALIAAYTELGIKRSITI